MSDDIEPAAYTYCVQLGDAECKGHTHGENGVMLVNLPEEVWELLRDEQPPSAATDCPNKCGGKLEPAGNYARPDENGNAVWTMVHACDRCGAEPPSAAKED